MRKEHVLTKISLLIDVAAFIIPLVYFNIAKPYLKGLGFGYYLLLSMPPCGVAGLIALMLGWRKSKTALSFVLIAVNIIMICWWPIYWMGGTLIFGP